jgi:hypothetical protein
MATDFDFDRSLKERQQKIQQKLLELHWLLNQGRQPQKPSQTVALANSPTPTIPPKS